MGFVDWDNNPLDIDLDVPPAAQPRDWAVWRYPDGTQVPITLGDEIEVSYPEIRPIRHRGLIHRCGPGPLDEVEVIHSRKETGVCVVSWQDFAQGNEVRLLRRPTSPEHARLILERAITAIRSPYRLLNANCEHFTDSCYTGLPGQSKTLQGIAVGVGVVALIAAVANSK